MKMILILSFLSDFWLSVLNLKNARHLKKETNEEMMLVAWHPNRWWNFCIPENETKEIEPIFLE